MPLHDWTLVSAGTYHGFHTAWITELARALNNGLLPEPFYAESEQIAGMPLPQMPLFLDSQRYVSLPLESAYNAAFTAIPTRYRDRLTVALTPQNGSP